MGQFLVGSISLYPEPPKASRTNFDASLECPGLTSSCEHPILKPGDPALAKRFSQGDRALAAAGSALLGEQGLGRRTEVIVVAMVSAYDGLDRNWLALLTGGSKTATVVNIGLIGFVPFHRVCTIPQLGHVMIDSAILDGFKLKTTGLVGP